MVNNKKKKTLLIVEDNLVNLRILSKILQSDYELLTADNGQTAMDILSTSEENSISAVVLDIVMPVMDGYEVLRRMRADKRLAQIPVIVASGNDSSAGDNKEVTALSLGANDYVTKPYKPDIIKHRIANAIYLRETAAFVNTVQHDSLTGLYSKDYFYLRVKEILEQSPNVKYDLICCDIEKFKVVNDLFGVEVGNKLLKHCADVLKKIFKNKGICGRITADVFALFSPRRAEYSAECFNNISDQINQFDINLNIQLRYGIYAIDDSSLPASIICDYARLACNSIKGKYGVSFAFFDEAIRQSLLAEQAITGGMKTALRDNQFQVYYQPKYDINSEKPVAAEALVRWIHPQKGVISPAQFIPLFEKNGFITELDIYIWDTVCGDISRWIKSGKSFGPISVNVSRADIYNPNLLKILLKMVRKHNIKPYMLHLEITETAYTENSKQLIGVLTRLKNIGFVIEMDDFGSGYSSLNMLSELPINMLKLDIKFLQTNRNNIILSFVISLAKWLNLPVIAEGVETKEQLMMLRELGCDYVQGYYYAKPMPKHDFEEQIVNNAQLSQSDGELHVQNETAVGSQYSADIKKDTLMIVDDVALNRCVLTEFFSGIYNIVEATNGKDAYDYIVDNYMNIDIIILDLIMPIMDGFILLRKLKTDEKLKNIPVVITSQGDEENEAKAFALGASDFIAKPYNKQVVIQRIKNALSKGHLQQLEEENALFQKMREVEIKAKTDGLTGLYNRTEFETQATNFFHNNNSQATFIILDIDNFKLINDRLGHITGDEAIQKEAEILKNCFDSNDLICRLGGDEFAIFIKAKLSQNELNNRLAKLCDKLKFNIENLSVTSSIGACSAPEFGTDYQTLYENADMALLSAKRLGKNQYKIFDGETELPSHVLFRNMDWLMDEASDAVIVCDAQNYELLYLNDVACKISGKSKKKCLGKKCYEVLWNLDKPCAHCVHINNLTKDYCEHEVKMPEINKSYIIKGKLVDWGGISARIQYVQDNTDKAAIAKQLSDISKDRKRLLDFMPGGIFRYSADENGDFDFVSKNMLDMLGYTRAQFDVKFKNKFSELVWHEDRARVLEEIAAQIKNGDSDECEYRIEKANGDLCTVHDVAKLVTDEDGSRWFYVTVIDITHSCHETKEGEGV